MNTGSNLLERGMERGQGLWRNLTWGSTVLGSLTRLIAKISNPVLRGSILASALGIPLEYLTNGVSMRSTVAGLGGAVGGTLGWLGGAALGGLTTWGAASVPLAMAGSAGLGWAGREGSLALYDWLTASKAASQQASVRPQDALSPTFNIGVNFDAMGRPTTTIDGPGATAARVSAPRLGPPWALGMAGG